MKELGHLPSGLHRKIFLNCTKYAFKLGAKEVKLLKAKKGTLLEIGRYHFQLITEDKETFYLFKVARLKIATVYKIKPDGGLSVNNRTRKVLDLRDFVDDEETTIQIEGEKIDVSEIKEIKVLKKASKKKKKVVEEVKEEEGVVSSVSEEEDKVEEEVPPLKKDKPKPPKPPKEDGNTKYFVEDKEKEEKEEEWKELQPEPVEEEQEEEVEEEIITTSSSEDTRDLPEPKEEIVSSGDDNKEDDSKKKPKGLKGFIKSFTKKPKEKEKPWFNETLIKHYGQDNETSYQSSFDILGSHGSYTDPEDTNNQQCFWFTLYKDFRNTDEFWKELKLYYRVSDDELEKKLITFSKDEKPPVFSRRERGDVNLVNLQTAIVQKINERLKTLDESKSSIRQQLLDVGDKLIKSGLDVRENEDYQQLQLDQKAISECIEKTYESLDNYTNLIKQIGEEAGSVLQKSVIDIHGCPEIVSKHYQQITDRLVNLNIEINSIRKSHLELEKELIKRLRDVEEAKDFKNKWELLEQERILEEYQEENKEAFENQDRAEVYKDIGALNESATFIQQKIEDEKKKINYYLDNLKSLAAYDNYEANLYELHKKKAENRRAIKNFRREIYKLQLWLSRKEKKHDDFFINVDKEISALRTDVASACADNSSLAEQCIRHWKSRWNNEGIPLMEEMFTRTSRIVEAFAPIPSTQIVKMSRLKERLMKEVEGRQREWKRVFDEVQKEFKEMNYELDVPVASELDSKYLDKLDAAVLTLSKDTQRAIFIPEEHFRLANYTDTRIGLEPKTVDDSSFLVLDQVWDTLTPEQEEELNRKLKEGKTDDRPDGSILAQEQLKNIKNRFPVKRASFEQNVRSLSDTERQDRFKDIESSELQTWRGDNYLIANSRGEFKEVLYEITKKLFSSKSVRVVDNTMEFTNTGYVRDGNTEILSAKDYFIKSEDKEPFVNATDDLDLSEIVDIHNEPDSEMIELLSDPTYVAHAKEREDKLAELSAPMKPTIAEWAQISLQKYKEEKGKTYDVEHLRGKLLEMEDELKGLKDYHAAKTAQLEKALSDRDSSFDELKEEVVKAQGYLGEKEKELRSILKETNQLIDNKLDSNHNEFFKPDAQSKGKKHGLMYWLNRLINGPKDKDGNDDFTTV